MEQIGEILTKLLRRLKKNAPLALGCKGSDGMKFRQPLMPKETFDSPRKFDAESLADLSNQLSNVDLAYLIYARSDKIQIEIGDRQIHNETYKILSDLSSISFDSTDIVLCASTSDYCDIYESPEFSEFISELRSADVVKLHT